VLYIILTGIFRRFQISNYKFEIQPVAPAMAIFVFQPHFGKIWPHPIKVNPHRMFYISSWPKFSGDSEYPIRNLKFSLWHLLQPYLCFSHILAKYDLIQSGWFIHHPDQIFEVILNIQSEIPNSACGICYSNICVSATFQENVTSSNEDGLYIILIEILRRFWIWSQKYQIPWVAHNIAIFVF